MFAYNEETKDLISLLDSKGYVVDAIEPYTGIADETRMQLIDGNSGFIGFALKICRRGEKSVFERTNFV
jgi:hypothetical protein